MRRIDARKLTPKRQRLLKQELGRQMRIISEEVACSLWAYKIEDELPPLLIEGAARQEVVNYKCIEISPVYSDWLVSLANELGHWVNQGRGKGYIRYVPKTLRTRFRKWVPDIRTPQLAKQARRQSLLASSKACEHEVAAFIDDAAELGDLE
jgi:hypothetical protein